MEKQIKRGTDTSLQAAMNTETKKLEELVELIKRPNMSKADKMTLGSLIVMDVHTKDVTAEVVDQRLNSIDAFEWISQMRHYVDSSVPEGINR